MNKLIQLMERSNLADLGPGPRPERFALARLEDLLATLGFANSSDIRALLLVWNDHHDLAHSIVQDTSGGTGAFIHGIIHRREPDYGNAAYWFRRVIGHPVFNRLPGEAEAIIAKSSARNHCAGLIEGGCWNPFKFIDLCASASGKKNAELIELCKQLQWIEARSLARHLIPSEE